MPLPGLDNPRQTLGSTPFNAKSISPTSSSMELLMWVNISLGFSHPRTRHWTTRTIMQPETTETVQTRQSKMISLALPCLSQGDHNKGTRPGLPIPPPRWPALEPPMWPWMPGTPPLLGTVSNNLLFQRQLALSVTLPYPMKTKSQVCYKKYRHEHQKLPHYLKESPCVLLWSIPTFLP